MAPIQVALFDAKEYDKTSFALAMKLHGMENDVTIQYIEPHLTKTTAKLAEGCQAVCGFVNDEFDKEVLQALSDFGIGLILCRSAGFDRVDVPFCKSIGMSVARVPAYSPYAVAEFASALLMTLNRKTHRAVNRVRDGNFTLDGLVGQDLYGKTVGVVGTGKIGQCFLNIMIGYGCKILAYDAYINESVKAKPEVRYTELDDLLKNSDFVSLHAPLNKDTAKMINVKTLALMKPRCLLINTSRGGLVDTKALIDAVVAGKIGGAALDVYENEAKYFFSDTSDHEIADSILAQLINMRNIIVTSHQSFLTEEALDAIASTTLLNIKEFFMEKKTLEKMTNSVLTMA